MLIVVLSRIFGASLGTSLRNGFYLAQAGEFALVLLALAVDQRIVPAPIAQVVLAAMVLSMLSAPLLIHFAEPLVRRFTANDWLARAAQITRIAATTMARQNHVIICGFGRSGQNLARAARGRGDLRSSRSTPIRSACARPPGRLVRRVRRRRPQGGAVRRRVSRRRARW